ncbi:MAG: AAA domain-containing protein [Bacteroidota bacterium]
MKIPLQLKSAKVNNQKEIWSLYTNAQEQILKYRALPISVDSSSLKLTSDKLTLKVNQNCYKDIFKERICDTYKLNLSEFDFGTPFFSQSIEITSEISDKVKEDLQIYASENYINFNPEPLIDGKIIQIITPFKTLMSLLKSSDLKFEIDNEKDLQLSISNIKKLKQIIENNNLPIKIDSSIASIFRINPSPIYFLKKIFKNYDFKYHQQSRTITTINGYIPEKYLQTLFNSFGLEIFGYKYTFIINENALKKYNAENSSFVLPSLIDGNTFVFSVNLSNTQERQVLEEKLLLGYDEEKHCYRLKYNRLNKFFTDYFGKENVSFHSEFVYKFNRDLYKDWCASIYDKVSDDFWSEIHSVLTLNGFSISEQSHTVGIDLDWEKSDLESKLKIISDLQIIDNTFHGDEHKCKVSLEFNNNSIFDVEKHLRESFPSIVTKYDNKQGVLKFRLFYKESSQLFKLHDLLKKELENLDKSIFSYEIDKADGSREKFLCEENTQLRVEDEENKIKALWGESFTVDNVELGVLFKTNYPILVFQINKDNFNLISSIIENKTINIVTPNLKGELDKIKRLKDTIELLTNSNKKLINPNIREFIFSSEKAKPIIDIDLHIDKTSELFKELELHQLNKLINNSQKTAIIKTLLAEDLAIIQGPPGTGKSTAIAEIIWQHIRRNPKERILLTSETNLAVDNAIDRIVNKKHNLVKPIRFGGESKLESEGKQFSLDILKMWVEGEIVKFDNENDENETGEQNIILENWIENIKNRSFKHCDIEKYPPDLQNKWDVVFSKNNKNIRQLLFINYLKNCNVIGATCSSIGELNSEGKWTGFYRTYMDIFGKCPIKFSTVIQDESSKATPSELALPLVFGEKSIIVGDHRQLPPLIDREDFLNTLDYLKNQTKNNTEKRSLTNLIKSVRDNIQALETSHFERLFTSIDDSLKSSFNLQYRMHPDINEVIKQFYVQDKGLDCGLINPIDLGVNDFNMNNPSSRYHGINIDGLITPDNHTIWIDVDSPELLEGTSRVNFGEIEAIRWVLSEFNKSESFNHYQNFWQLSEDKRIGLISFYGKQLKYLKTIRNDFRNIPIRISTVDRFQGMERNIIIVSMVRSNKIALEKNQKADYTIYPDLGYTKQTSLGFAELPNRLNVALSRARRLLIIVGNSQLFTSKPIYRKVFESIMNNPNGRIIKFPHI